LTFRFFKIPPDVEEEEEEDEEEDVEEDDGEDDARWARTFNGLPSGLCDASPFFEDIIFGGVQRSLVGCGQTSLLQRLLAYFKHVNECESRKMQITLWSC
jgi:hypothetical protein